MNVAIDTQGIFNHISMSLEQAGAAKESTHQKIIRAELVGKQIGDCPAKDACRVQDRKRVERDLLAANQRFRLRAEAQSTYILAQAFRGSEDLEVELSNPVRPLASDEESRSCSVKNARRGRKAQA